MALPVPSVTQPRIHLWRPPPFGTAAMEQHGAFCPLVKPYIAGTTPFTGGVNNFLWTGYGFGQRTQTAASHAARAVDDQLRAIVNTWGLADSQYGLLVQSPNQIDGWYNLMARSTDAITDIAYRALDRVAYVANGIAGYSAPFDTAGSNFFGLMNNLMAAAMPVLPTPGWLLMDSETDRSRCYDACNTGTPGNWPGQVADGRAGTEGVIADLTGPLAMTPKLGHATARTVNSLNAGYSWGNTNLSWSHPSNIATSRLYERDMSALEDNAMAKSVYKHALATWPTIRCGNYDVGGFVKSPTPYRSPQAAFLPSGYRATATDLFDLSCPVLYAFQQILENDLATLWTQGWSAMSPSQDAMQLMLNFARSQILGMQANKAAGYDSVFWYRAPGSSYAGDGVDIWAKDAEYTVELLTMAFRAGIFAHFIHWSFDEAFDPDLSVWCVDKAAARCGISWGAV